MAANHFQRVFTSEGTQNVDVCLSNIPTLVTADLNKRLEAPVSEQEIKKVVDSLGSLKAPGPYGFNGLFYKTHWSTIRDDVCKAINQFFLDGSLPGAINETVVALVPKIQNPESINQYRPISCCNFFSKVCLLSPNAPPLTHFLFVDDALFFSKATPSEAFALTSILNSYSLASGQRINVAKSGLICGARMTPALRKGMEDIFSIKCWDHPDKYLGLPADWARSKTRTLNWILERVKYKVQGWKESLLYFAGKEVLIKSVIQAIPTYAMAVFKFPKGLCSKLNSLVARFWWQGSKGDAGIHWRSWQVMTRSKKDGGLGFKEFSAMNPAHLAKQAWRIMQNLEALWVKVLKGIYFPNQSFLQVKKKNGGSWIWNNILQGRDFARRRGQWLVANGREIQLWDDNWLWSRESTKAYTNGSTYTVQEALDTANRAWNCAFLRAHLPPALAIKVVQTPIAWFQLEDRLTWPYTPDGGYTIKTGYQVAVGEQQMNINIAASSHSAPMDLWKHIWELKTPQKIIFFLWRACTNALPTAANLSKKGLPIGPNCPICQAEIETIEHTLLLCPWTTPVWFGSQFQWLPTPNNFTRFDTWILGKFNQLQQDKASFHYNLALIANILWSIWKQRNNHTFRDSNPDPTQTLIQANHLHTKFWAANVTLQQVGPQVPQSLRAPGRWRNPPLGVIKCNSDAAWSPTGMRGASAFLGRDHRGILLLGQMRILPIFSSLAAEALALRDAVLAAYNLDWEKVLFESDNLQLIEACRGERSLSGVQHIIDDIRTIASGFIHSGFTWVKREGNSPAHLLAHHCSNHSLPPNWVTSQPTWLRSSLSADLPPPSNGNCGADSTRG
ncbi:Ribonuclease H-like superfamily [Sesbania bispinosa]|nr:Ribonuclease H-like superfamily [Sesbania bispinosa]